MKQGTSHSPWKELPEEEDIEKERARSLLYTCSLNLQRHLRKLSEDAGKDKDQNRN